MTNILRVSAVLTSVSLMAAFVTYKGSAPRDESQQVVLPSSKMGTALDMYSTDYARPLPSSSPLYLPVMSGSKSALIVEREPVIGVEGWKPKTSNLSDEERKNVRRAVMGSSKSGKVVTPEEFESQPSEKNKRTIMSSSKSGDIVVPEDLAPSPTPTPKRSSK